MFDHFHAYTPDEKTCSQCSGHVYEIKVRPTSGWTKVTAYIFRSWSGERRLDGEIYEGPVYYVGTNEVYYHA